MPPPSTGPCRILAYGQDETLLMTRKAILEVAAGLKSDTAKSAEDFLDCIRSSERGYDIFILCHSIPCDQQQIIQDEANGSGVQIYTMTGLVEPHKFIADVRAMLSDCEDPPIQPPRDNTL
jgi:hypothetical protein